MKFKEYLVEITKRKLLSNTDKKRIEQAVKKMSAKPPKITELDSGLERLEYNVKMTPPRLSTEKRNHRGYIDYDPKTKNIENMYCDCNDWSYRLWSPMVKAGLATWEQPKLYKKRQSFTNNKKNTIITNPKNIKYVCKHLAAVLIGYF